jgi:hypothetical protein
VGGSITSEDFIILLVGESSIVSEHANILSFEDSLIFPDAASFLIEGDPIDSEDLKILKVGDSRASVDFTALRVGDAIVSADFLPELIYKYFPSSWPFIEFLIFKNGMFFIEAILAIHFYEGLLFRRPDLPPPLKLSMILITSEIEGR